MVVRPSDSAARRPDLIVVGHANLDRFLRVAALPAPDRTVPVTADETRLGGTAVNLARSAAGWGVSTALVTRVGEDFPSAFLRQLADEGVDLSGVERVAGVPSSTCFIVEDGRGSQMTLIDQGPMADASAAALPRDLLASAGWVHLTTAEPDYALRIKRVARASGARITVDPAQEIHYRWDAARFRRLVDGAEILFGNRSEIVRAVELTGVRSPSALTDLVPLVVMTEGARGARAYTRTGEVRTAGRPLRRFRQVTGAGDAFRGGFYAGWFAGQPLAACLTAGARSASRWMATGGPRPRGRGRRR